MGLQIEKGNNNNNRPTTQMKGRAAMGGRT